MGDQEPPKEQAERMLAEFRARLIRAQHRVHEILDEELSDFVEGRMAWAVLVGDADGQIGTRGITFGHCEDLTEFVCRHAATMTIANAAGVAAEGNSPPPTPPEQRN